MTELETKLKAAVDECLDAGMGTLILPALGRALEGRGVKFIGAVVGIETRAQVVVTADLDDVTAQTVSDVVTPVLLKVGVAPEQVPMIAAGAATAVSRMVRNRVLKQQQAVAAPPPQPVEEPKWKPRSRRR